MDTNYIKMDFSLDTPEARTAHVQKIIDNTPSERLTPKYLTILTDYILFISDKQDKQKRKEQKIITDNRMLTLNKRETSFEGLVGKLENGEDGIYGMIANDKNIIFTPKAGITDEDVAEIPGMRQLRDDINRVEQEVSRATGRNKFILKKQLIELRRDQYVLRNAYKKPMYCINTIKSTPKIDFSEEVFLDENDEVYSTGAINLYNPSHVSILLCSYSKIKADNWDNFNGDAKWLIMDLENIIDAEIKENYPLYYKLLVYKIDGKQNAEIQQLLYDEFGIKHSVEYISSLWRNKIPKLIAERAANDWLIWHYTYEERGYWKKCSRCGQIKLGHNHFFSKNSTSKDKLYSICKECRNNKKKERLNGELLIL